MLITSKIRSIIFSSKDVFKILLSFISQEIHPYKFALQQLREFFIIFMIAFGDLQKITNFLLHDLICAQIFALKPKVYCLNHIQIIKPFWGLSKKTFLFSSIFIFFLPLFEILILDFNIYAKAFVK